MDQFNATLDTQDRRAQELFNEFQKELNKRENINKNMVLQIFNKVAEKYFRKQITIDHHPELKNSVDNKLISKKIAELFINKFGNNQSSISELVSSFNNHQKSKIFKITDLKPIITLYQSTHDLKKSINLWKTHNCYNTTLFKSLIESYQTILCIDIETNNTDIIQIGITDLNNLTTISNFVKSKTPINLFEYYIHNIDQKKLDNEGLSKEEMFKKFEPIIRNADLIICHNLNHDKPFLLSHFGDIIYRKNLLCSMEITKPIVNAVNCKGQLKNPSMWDLIEFCKNGPHVATADIEKLPKCKNELHNADIDSEMLARCIRILCQLSQNN